MKAIKSTAVKVVTDLNFDLILSSPNSALYNQLSCLNLTPVVSDMPVERALIRVG